MEVATEQKNDEDRGAKEGGKQPESCLLIIFGATGDLTARKLLPALYALAEEKQLPPAFGCVGVARKPKSDAQFRAEMKEAVQKLLSAEPPFNETLWSEFEQRLFYHTTEFGDLNGYIALKDRLDKIDSQLGTKQNRIFYLSIQPSFFPLVCENLHAAHLVQHARLDEAYWTRVIVEKPFGRDLESAKLLQSTMLRFMHESQIYRIDHYLGKETVQNILVFRFANFLFESAWNSHYIDHIQIMVAESQGVGSRGVFWEEAGWLRDVVQNHMMQILALVTMEPPTSFSATAVRNEKVKVLQALRPLSRDDLQNACVRGQYGAGYIEGKALGAYRDEPNVNPHSQVETFAALCCHIDNWRWSGVPIYLCGGKRMPKRTTSVTIVFKEPPYFLFPHGQTKGSGFNVLTLRIQPDEGACLKFHCKLPGSESLAPVKMDFRYSAHFGKKTPEAYERLILDAMCGDSTLFIRSDETEAAWSLLTPLLNFWSENKEETFPNYGAGTWGPSAAGELIKRQGRHWILG